MESVFVHVTVVPGETVSGFGLNAFDPSAAAPVGIEMFVDDGALDVLGGDGAVGELAELEDEDPQAIARNETSARRPIRNRSENINFLRVKHCSNSSAMPTVVDYS
jgi:hypothetical protein